MIDTVTVLSDRISFLSRHFQLFKAFRSFSHSNISTVDVQLFHNFIRLLQLLFVASQVVLGILKILDAQIDFDCVACCGLGSLFSSHFRRIRVRLKHVVGCCCDGAFWVHATRGSLGLCQHREYSSEQSTFLGGLRLATGHFQRTHTVLEVEISPTHSHGGPVVVHGCARRVVTVELEVLIKAERPTGFA